ncbi:MAG: protein kinase, partial [Planctomycetota bacterium]|nr:protein kinase [Planctomycetota bacterium]
MGIEHDPTVEPTVPDAAVDPEATELIGPEGEATWIGGPTVAPTVANEAGGDVDPGASAGSGFGRFTDLEYLDEGGMGQVLTATDPDIERRVAIKILRPDIESHRDHLVRFKNEFKLTGQLEHPNIVPVHETGRTDDGRIYFCMKWVQGETLAQLLKEQRNLAARRGGAIDPTPFLKHLLRVC